MRSVETSEGRVSYRMEAADRPQPAVRVGEIQGVWFSQHNAKRASQGLPALEKMGDIPKGQRKTLKSETKAQSQTGWRDKPLSVERKSEGQVWLRDEEGNLFGSLKTGIEGLKDGDQITLHHSIAKDGNLKAVYSIEKD